MIDEVIITLIVIIVFILVGFIIWYFTLRDDGNMEGENCGQENHCQRGLHCINGVCQQT